jgi:membrane-bound serine protease (ClpP class)
MTTAHSSFIFIASLVAAAGLLALVILIAARSRHKKSSRAELSLVGRLASVEVPLIPEGSVLVDGELWRARVVDAVGRVGRGRANVRVTGARGHLLEVEPVDRSALPTRARRPSNG